MAGERLHQLKNPDSWTEIQKLKKKKCRDIRECVTKVLSGVLSTAGEGTYFGSSKFVNSFLLAVAECVCRDKKIKFQEARLSVRTYAYSRRCIQELGTNLFKQLQLQAKLCDY